MKKVLRTLAAIASVAMMAAAMAVPASAQAVDAARAVVCVSNNQIEIRVNAAITAAGEGGAWLFMHTQGVAWGGNADELDEIGGFMATAPEHEDGITTRAFLVSDVNVPVGVLLGTLRPANVDSIAQAQTYFTDESTIQEWVYCTCPDCDSADDTTPEPDVTGEPDVTTAPEADVTEAPATTAPAPATTVATTTTADAAPPTGVALAIIPTVIAAGAAIVAAKKRK